MRKSAAAFSLLGVALMTGPLEDGLGALNRIIAGAEERRVEQMIHIAVLLADEGDPTETRAELARTERLLRIMRTQRTLLIRTHPAVILEPRIAPQPNEGRALLT